MSWIHNKKIDKHVLRWKHVDQACESICDKIGDNVPDHIIALARGGLVPASIIANRLGVRRVYSMGVASYKPGEDHSTRDQFDVYQQISINNENIKPSDRVLIVDDISDRGDTFDHVYALVSRRHAVQIRTASIIVKPETTHVPDYYHTKVPQDCWVVFPWEK